MITERLDLDYLRLLLDVDLGVGRLELGSLSTWAWKTVTWIDSPIV
jgi:hypothetical protein